MIKNNFKYLNELKSSLEDKISVRKKRKLIALKIALFSFILSFVFWNNDDIIFINDFNNYFCSSFIFIYVVSILFFIFYKTKNKNILEIENILITTNKI